MNADKEVCKPFNYMASPGPLSKHSKGPEAQLGEKVSMSMLMSLGSAHQALHAPWEWRGERLSSCFPEWRFRMQKHATSVYWKRLMGRGPHHEGNGSSMLMSVRSQPNAHKTHKDARPQRCKFRGLKKSVQNLVML